MLPTGHELVITDIFLFMSRFLQIFSCTWTGDYRYFPVHESAYFLHMSNYLPVFSCTWAGDYLYFPVPGLFFTWFGTNQYFPVYEPVLTIIFCTWAGTQQYSTVHEPVITGVFLLMSRYLPVFSCTWAGTRGWVSGTQFSKSGCGRGSCKCWLYSLNGSLYSVQCKSKGHPDIQ